MLGYDSALDTVDPDNWGKDYKLMKEGWALARLANAEKYKTAIQREEPDILNSKKSLENFVESLEQKLKPHMKHIMTGTGEVSEAVSDWLTGLLEFRKNYSQDVGLFNLTDERILDMIDRADQVGLIGGKEGNRMKMHFMAPPLLKKLSEFKPFSPDSITGKPIWWSFIIGNAAWRFLKGLGWWWASFGAIGTFLKQLFTQPK